MGSTTTSIPVETPSPMRILICADGSRWALKSARFALQLFRHTAHELTILTFKIRARELPKTRKTITRATRKKEDNIGAERSAVTIERELEDLVDELSIDTREITWLREEGDMAEHVLDIAEDYDLVCLGGAGKGGFSQHMLGLIADQVVLEGKGNLLVTKTSDCVCRDILVALRSSSIDDNLANYLGTLFQGSSARITLDVLWEELPGRFEGYLDAAVGQRMKEMVDDELFEPPEELQNIVEILDGYGIECTWSYKDYHSLDELINDVEPNAYDLMIIHPPPRSTGLRQLLEPRKQSLNLMRKSSPNVMLLRDLPVHES